MILAAGAADNDQNPEIVAIAADPPDQSKQRAAGAGIVPLFTTLCGLSGTMSTSNMRGMSDAMFFASSGQPARISNST